MTRYITSAQVLLKQNGESRDWRNISTQELNALVKEILLIWRPDMENRVWFDVEKQLVNGLWETRELHVVCYHIVDNVLNDKTQRADIPQIYIRELCGGRDFTPLYRYSIDILRDFSLSFFV
jgi:hypothetical protein